MNEHTLRILEFDKVLGIIAGYALSDAGKEFVQATLPVSDPASVKDRLRETEEFMRILESGERPPLEGIFDIRRVVEKLDVMGSMLNPGELLQTAATLGAGRRVRIFFHRIEGRGNSAALKTPLLSSYAAAIRPLKDLEDAIFSAIDDRSEVKDSASPELRRIRKQIARTRDEVLSRLSSILQNSMFHKVIQEPVVTVREDRYVLPLKPGFRQSLNGVVHGQSGSRATLFVEPLEVLEQNNRLAELRMEEQEEVDRILRELTARLAAEADTIREIIKALAAIDAICARARFGVDCSATIPDISSDRAVRLRNARHPLLVWKQKTAGGKDVTPNDLELERGEHALILSGPNAGGKTVVLKMIGLLALMAQAGLPLTAGGGSALPCFSSIFADIGDEQSIEQELSTFSSHMAQIAAILRQAGRDSLVLLDELGSGTDPGEGAGLGAAILGSLIECGCVTIVTTHHNALKLFGSQTAGAVNAAMEFDPQTLKPTYRLLPGRPGRSYGLDMAARIGVPDPVIRKARQLIGEEDTKLEDLLRKVEDDSRALAAERETLAQRLAAADRQRSEAEASLRTAREEARGIQSKARTEAKEVLSSLRQKLRELSRITAPEPAAIKAAASEVEALGRKLEPGPMDAVPAPGRMLPDLHAGDRIRISRLNRTATVIASQGGQVEIEIGGKKVRMASQDLFPIEPLHHRQETPAVPGWGAELHEDASTTDRLNIVGFRVDEGLAEVERFLDRATMGGLTIVAVIHGLGTGALKHAVSEFLKNHPLVSATRTGEPAEGGAGITVVELKK